MEKDWVLTGIDYSRWTKKCSLSEIIGYVNGFRKTRGNPHIRNRTCEFRIDGIAHKFSILCVWKTGVSDKLCINKEIKSATWYLGS